MSHHAALRRFPLRLFPEKGSFHVMMTMTKTTTTFELFPRQARQVSRRKKYTSIRSVRIHVDFHFQNAYVTDKICRPYFTFKRYWQLYKLIPSKHAPGKMVDAGCRRVTREV